MNETGLLDAAVSGDMVSYWYWNNKIDAGNGIKGDIDGELIDNVNLFVGDPNNPQINDAYGPVQPYIVLAFRRMVADVKREAKDNGINKDNILTITKDLDTDKQSGDMSKNELEGDDGGKCTVLLEMWNEPENIYGEVNGKKIVVGAINHIMARKSTKGTIVRDTWDTGLHRYPVAAMNWYQRKNSIHGEAEMTYLIPNQILINQQAAMIALWIKLHGFPKVLYDKNKNT